MKFEDHYNIQLTVFFSCESYGVESFGIVASPSFLTANIQANEADGVVRFSNGSSNPLALAWNRRGE